MQRFKNWLGGVVAVYRVRLYLIWVLFFVLGIVAGAYFSIEAAGTMCVHYKAFWSLTNTYYCNEVGLELGGG